MIQGVDIRPAKRRCPITRKRKRERSASNKIYLQTLPPPVGLPNAHDSHQQGTCVSDVLCRSPSPETSDRGTREQGDRGGRNVSQALPFVLRASLVIERRVFRELAYSACRSLGVAREELVSHSNRAGIPGGGVENGRTFARKSRDLTLS